MAMTMSSVYDVAHLMSGRAESNVHSIKKTACFFKSVVNVNFVAFYFEVALNKR